MLAAQDVAALCKERGITALHIKLRATGGTRSVACVLSLTHTVMQSFPLLSGLEPQDLVRLAHLELWLDPA